MAQSSVAEIVAETMDNYLLLGHILRCKVLPASEVHPEMWIGANRKFRAVPSVRLERARLEKPRTEDEREKAERRLAKRQAAKKAKVAALGIDYDMDAAAIVRPGLCPRSLRFPADGSASATATQKATPTVTEA